MRAFNVLRAGEVVIPKEQVAPQEFGCLECLQESKSQLCHDFHLEVEVCQDEKNPPKFCGIFSNHLNANELRVDWSEKMLHSSEIRPLESFPKQHFVLHLARSLAVAHEDLGGSSPPIHVKQRQPAPSRGETLSTTPVPVSPRVAGPLPSARAHEFVLYTWETTFHSRQHVDLSASDVQALREELAEHGYRAAPCMTSSMRLVPTWKLLY